MKNRYFIGGILALDLVASVFIISMLVSFGPKAPTSCIWQGTTTTCHGAHDWVWGNKEYDFMADGSISVSNNFGVSLLSFHAPNGTLAVNLISYTEGSATSSFHGYQYVRWTFQRGEAAFVVAFGQTVSATLYEWGSVPPQLLDDLKGIQRQLI